MIKKIRNIINAIEHLEAERCSLLRRLLTDESLLESLTGVLDVLDIQSLVGGVEIDGAGGAAAPG